jgi:hypothetical protein
MSHFLFCIKEYTNIKGYLFCRPFLNIDTLVVLLNVDLSTFGATYRRPFWRHLTASLASLNDVHYTIYKK